MQACGVLKVEGVAAVAHTGSYSHFPGTPFLEITPMKQLV